MTYQPSGERPDQHHPAHRGPSSRPVPHTNRLAVLALVFAFLFAPAAIVLGLKAKRQIDQTGEQGASLASAGLVLGTAITALFLFGCLLLVIGALLSGTRDIY